MSEAILNKLVEHDAKFVQINTKLVEHDRRFDAIDKRLDDHEGQLDFLAKKALEHDEKFDSLIANMATKADMAKITKTLDYLVKLGEKHEQEMTMMSHGMLRLTERTERLEKHCGIA